MPTTAKTLRTLREPSCSFQARRSNASGREWRWLPGQTPYDEACATSGRIASRLHAVLRHNATDMDLSQLVLNDDECIFKLPGLRYVQILAAPGASTIPGVENLKPLKEKTRDVHQSGEGCTAMVSKTAAKEDEECRASAASGMAAAHAAGAAAPRSQRPLVVVPASSMPFGFATAFCYESSTTKQTHKAAEQAILLHDDDGFEDRNW